MPAGAGSPSTGLDRRRRPAPSEDLVVSVGQAALGFLIGALGACLILLARDLDVPRTRLAWLSGGFGTALLVAGPVGPLVLARTPRRVLRVSAGILASGAAALALAPVLILAEGGAALLGISGAGIVLATPALLTGPSAARRLSRVNALASLAGVVGPLALSLVDRLPGSGRLALLAPVPLLLWLVTSRGAPTPPPAAAGAPVRSSAFHGSAFHGSAFREVRRPETRRVRVFARWATMVLAVAAEFAFAVWAAARLQDSGLSVSRAAAAAAAFPLGMAVGRLVATRLVDRPAIVPISAALVLVGTVVLTRPGGPAVCTAALAVAGLGIAVLYPLTLADLMHEPGLAESHGAALGATASGTAILSGPLLISLASAATSLRVAFVVVIPMLLGLLALRWCLRAA